MEIISNTYLSLSATGAAQSSLEGNALASGCTGCDNKATYATITKVIFDQNDDAMTGLVIEDAGTALSLSVGDTFELNTYATFEAAAPVKVDPVYAIPSADADKAKVENGVLTALSAGSTTLTATYPAGASAAKNTVSVALTIA